MPWNIQRGRYGAEALTEEEIQTLQASQSYSRRDDVTS
jgi:hypothetical protein